MRRDGEGEVAGLVCTTSEAAGEDEGDDAMVSRYQV